MCGGAGGGRDVPLNASLRPPRPIREYFALHESE